MNPDSRNIQGRLRGEARTILQRLSAEQRDALVIKSWMAHDARWFRAVAQLFGMHEANAANKLAVKEAGRAEARRVLGVLDIQTVASLDDYLVVQEVLADLFTDGLVDYDIVRVDESTFRFDVRQCFAYEQTERAGVASAYECGIFARVIGWLEGAGLDWQISPALGLCLKAQGKECSYSFTVKEGGGTR